MIANPRHLLVIAGLLTTLSGCEVVGLVANIALSSLQATSAVISASRRGGTAGPVEHERCVGPQNARSCFRVPSTSGATVRTSGAETFVVPGDAPPGPSAAPPRFLAPSGTVALRTETGSDRFVAPTASAYPSSTQQRPRWWTSESGVDDPSTRSAPVQTNAPVPQLASPR